MAATLAKAIEYTAVCHGSRVASASRRSSTPPAAERIADERHERGGARARSRRRRARDEGDPLASAAARRSTSPSSLGVPPSSGPSLEDAGHGQHDRDGTRAGAATERQPRGGRRAAPPGCRSPSRASPVVGPPRMRMTPNDVKQKRNVSAAAADEGGAELRAASPRVRLRTARRRARRQPRSRRPGRSAAQHHRRSASRRRR